LLGLLVEVEPACCHFGHKELEKLVGLTTALMVERLRWVWLQLLFACEQLRQKPALLGQGVAPYNNRCN
jgi:hypothetical protein